MSSELKQIKTENGNSLYITSKCYYCRREFDIQVNQNSIEVYCPNCDIWKRY